MLSTQQALSDDIQSLLGKKRVSGAAHMLRLVENRVCQEVPLHIYESECIQEMFDSFVRDIQLSRHAIHAQKPHIRIVSLCVFYNIIVRTCDSWFCSEVSAFLGMPMDAKAFLLSIEDKMVNVGRLTTDTLRLYLRSMTLLVDLEKHIALERSDAWMMPGGIQALNVKGFEHVILKDYIVLARKTGRKPVRKAFKRVFSEI